MKQLDRILVQSYLDEMLENVEIEDINVSYKGNYRIVVIACRTIGNEIGNIPQGYLAKIEFKMWSSE